MNQRTGKFIRSFTGNVPLLAQMAAAWILHRIPLPKDRCPSFAVELGTGWGNAFLMVPGQHLTSYGTIPFNEVFGLGGAGVEGQHGELSIVEWGERTGVILHGKRHLNEEPPEESSGQLRLLNEIIFALGVEQLILLGACGSYNPKYAVGNVFLPRKFYDLAQPIAVSHPSEGFYYADDGIDRMLVNRAIKAASFIPGLRIQQGNYVQTLGPHLGGELNTSIMRRNRVDAVSMSGWGEMYNAAMLGKKGLIMFLVTDKAGERSTHKKHQELGEKMANPLSQLLDAVVMTLPEPEKASTK